MKQIDLHVHSLASDGTFSPSELVRYAEEKGLFAFALTDHDTVNGIPEALQAAKDSAVRLIPGIELSCEYEGRDIHILGLNIDHEDPELLSHLEEFRSSRTVRNQQMAALLAENGFDISMEALTEEFPGAVITRSHIAKHLMQKGYVSSIEQGFDQYVGMNAPYYIPRKRLAPQQAIQWIHHAGGRAVLAHPLLYRLSPAKLWELTALLKACGLDGLEAIYSRNESGDEENMKKLAADFQLAVSGGSDFHGANKPHIDLMTGRGDLYVPASLLEKLLPDLNFCWE